MGFLSIQYNILLISAFMQSSDPQSIVLEAPFPRNTKILHLKKGPSVEGVWKNDRQKSFYSTNLFTFGCFSACDIWICLQKGDMYDLQIYLILDSFFLKDILTISVLIKASLEKSEFSFMLSYMGVSYLYIYRYIGICGSTDILYILSTVGMECMYIYYKI